MSAVALDKILRRTLIAVIVADVILFLNVARPESLTTMSYDPWQTVWQQWLVVVAMAIGAVLIVRAIRRRLRKSA